MDPEIQRALSDGWKPKDIATELQRRGLPIPPELTQLINQQDFSSFVNQGAGPEAAPESGSVGAGLAVGAGSALAAHPYLGAGILGAAGIKGTEMATRSARAGRRITSILEGSGGVEGLQKQLDAFKAAGRTDVTLADLSDAARAQADFVATNNPEARDALAAIHHERQLGVPGRVRQDVVGLSPTGAAAPRSEILSNKAAQAAFGQSQEGFEGLRRANPTLADPATFVSELGLDNPQAKPEMRPLRDAFAKIQAKYASAGAGAPPPPSFNTLQQMDRELQKQITTAFAEGDGELGKELKGVRQKLFDIIEHQVGPQYRDAARRYRAFSQRQELLQAGLDFWSQPQQLEDIAARVHGMTPEELNVFRRGVAGGLLTQIDAAKKGSNVARQLLKDSEANTAKLKVIFGNQATFQRFVSRLELENSLAKLGDVIGNSATARRLSEMEAEAPLVGGARAAEGILSPKHAILSFIGEKLLPHARVYARGTAKELEPMFTTRGVPALEELLRTLSRIR